MQHLETQDIQIIVNQCLVFLVFYSSKTVVLVVVTLGLFFQVVGVDDAFGVGLGEGDVV